MTSFTPKIMLIRIDFKIFDFVGFHIDKVHIHDAKTCEAQYWMNINSLNESWCQNLEPFWKQHEDYKTYLEGIPYNNFSSICAVHSVSCGDSGSPIMYEASKENWVVLGIAKDGTNQKRRVDLCKPEIVEEHFVRFSSVMSSLPWIRKIIGENTWISM